MNFRKSSLSVVRNCPLPLQLVHFQDMELSLQLNVIEERSGVSESCSVPRISIKHKNIAKPGQDVIG